MKFAKSYEPGEFEPEIYAAWEAAGVFKPREPQYPTNDASSRGEESEKGLDQSKYYGIVMGLAFILSMFIKIPDATSERKWKFAHWAWFDGGARRFVDAILQIAW